MRSPAGVPFILSLLVAHALVACSAPPRKDPLPLADAPPGSTTRGAPSESPLLTPSPSSSDLPAPPTADTGDDDAQGNAEPDAAAPSSCEPQTMAASAPATSCSVASYTYSGGSPSPGEYALAQWADGSASCTCPNQHQGTMSIHEIDGKLYMRWTRSVDTETTAGTYLLTFEDATTLRRKELCGETAEDEPPIVSYTATANEIVFVHDQGQERWTRIATSTSSPPPAFPR